MLKSATSLFSNFLFVSLSKSYFISKADFLQERDWVLGLI